MALLPSVRFHYSGNTFYDQLSIAGYYFQCRYHYRKNELEMKKISHAFSQAPFLEGTAADEEWREKANMPMPEKRKEED